MIRQIYDETSPITGNRCVLVEPDAEKRDNLKLCMESGYHTYEMHWKVGSDAIEQLERTLPNIIINSKFTDSSGQVWYKMMLITPFLILIPEPNDTGTEEWVIYTLKDGDPVNDEIVMSIESEDGNLIYRAIDKDSRQAFPEYKFDMAMDAYQVIGAAVNGKLFEMLNTPDND